LKTVVVSHGAEAGYVSQFIWDGARDYAPALALLTAVLLWEQLDLPRVISHNHQLVLAAATLLATRWQTDVLFADPARIAAMMLVRLPPASTSDRFLPASTAAGLTSTHAKAIQDQLFHRHHIEVPVKLLNNSLFVRISAHVYNTLADYERLATAILYLYPPLAHL
jgi:selenocysteine lyase/cysteine desulfurase